jgi:hypothetical protein
MSNYIKGTNFTVKDTLPSGNASKIIRGAEIDDELTAIASAVSSKADINSPTFTGTVVLPSTTSVGSVSSTELGYVDGVTSSIQNQLDTLTSAKALKTTTITAEGGLTGGGDLSANRTISIASTSMGYGTRTVSASDPTGGTDGDIWLKVE